MTRRLLGLGLLTLASAALAADRTPDDILKAIRDVKMPELNAGVRTNEALRNEFIADQQKALAKIGDLVGELYKVDPKNPELLKLMPARWQSELMAGPTKIKALRAELDDVAKNAGNEKLRPEAAFFRLRLILGENPNDESNVFLKSVEGFVRDFPKDPRSPILLYQVAQNTQEGPKRVAILKRIVKEFPDSEIATAVGGSLRRLDAVGKPFELAFKDAIKGTPVSIKGLKGKVVVIDFWATWCGPCVAELPKMKALYAKYKPQGVEFLGVSLDKSREEGGYEALKTFVAEREVPWPQYYQGDSFNGSFSESWGVDSIPSLFLVDAEGNLVSTEARENLEDLIVEQLKKAKGGAAGGQ